MSDYLSSLNTAQRLAVQTINGPVLIIAGAGTGKTRTLTYRLAYMAEQAGIPPERLLALTFTTKAAEEMKARVALLCKRGTDLSSAWIGTIHSLCNCIVRANAEVLGIAPDFKIISPARQAAIIGNLVPRFFTIQHSFSVKKYAHMLSKEKMRTFSLLRDTGVTAEKGMSAFCRAYQEILDKEGRLDFDDLLIRAFDTLGRTGGAIDGFRGRFSHVFVDEFQDISPLQYLLIKELAGTHANLCVVGDIDQAIYAFRGAQVKIFLSFQKDFPGAKIIKLEENYRSTATILAAAQNVIEKNTGRIPKRLISTKPPGPKITIYEACDEKAEADFIIKEIEHLMGGTRFETLSHQGENDERYVKGFSDIAILYRIHAQNRALKNALQHAGFPVQVASSLSLYEQKDIQDIIAVLEVINDPADDTSLCEVLSSAVKGIGSKTIQYLFDRAQQKAHSLFDELKQCNVLSAFSRSQQKSIDWFFKALHHLIEKSKQCPLNQLIEDILIDVYGKNDLSYKNGDFLSDEADNLLELITAAAPFSHLPASQGIALFLDYLAKLKEGEVFHPQKEAIRLMTVHGAKGLEFPVVFITGLEEGLFPYTIDVRSDSEQDPEEERRLFYVAVTRAQEKLYLLYARSRFLFGERMSMPPSSFLSDIPDDARRFSPGLMHTKTARRKKPKKSKQLSLFP